MRKASSIVAGCVHGNFGADESQMGSDDPRLLRTGPALSAKLGRLDVENRTLLEGVYLQGPDDGVTRLSNRTRPNRPLGTLHAFKPRLHSSGEFFFQRGKGCSGDRLAVAYRERCDPDTGRRL